MVNWLSGKKKITTMLLGIVSGLAIIFGLNQGEINTVAGSVVIVISAVSYMIAEGKIDVERIKNAAQAVQDAVDVLDDDVVVQGFTAEGGADDGK